MKAFFTTILAVLCAFVLIAGNWHWNKQNIVSGNQEKDRTVYPETSEEKTEADVNDKLIKLTSNWPAQSKESFKMALEEKRPFKILIVGSEAVELDEEGWAFITKNELLEAYGSSNLSVDIIQYTKSTKQFAEEMVSELSEEKADLILFEPFTLADNAELKIEDSILYIEEIMENVRNDNPDIVFILQPPNPIFSPRYYATQVEGLREFAQTKEIEYLDHWDAWPDTSSEEIKKYVDDSSKLPTAEGHQLWSEFISAYFISE
jgi:hypothetical protein